MPNKDQKEKIRAAYIDYVLSKGERPSTVYVFMKELDLPEEDFYKHFSTFDAVEASAWRAFFNHTLDTIKTQDVFAGYSSREKILAFYYGLVEHLKAHRSYVTWCFKNTSKLQFSNPVYLSDFKKMFEEFANNSAAPAINFGSGVTEGSASNADAPGGAAAPSGPAAEERNRILDLFRN